MDETEVSSSDACGIIVTNGETINAGNSKVTVKNLNTGTNGATFKATSVSV